MTTTYDIPLPGDTLGGTTVIASVWGRDEDPVFWVLLLLHPTAPFYSVQEVVQHGPTTILGRFSNINEAVECYSDNGGDS